jgi:hypothetical protein
MGIDLAALATNTATTVVPFGDSEINISYRPSVATPNNLKAITADEDDEVGPFIDFFISLVLDWDVTDGGKTVPLSDDGVGSVPMSVLQKIMRTVMADSQEAGEAASPSSSG